MMDEVLLAALLIGWAAVLLPSALRSRRHTDPHVSIGGFNHAMSVLRGRPNGREIMVPRQADRIVEHAASGQPRRSAASTRPSARASKQRALMARRRAMFVRLLVVTVGTFGLAMVFNGLWWPAFLTSAIALFGYVTMLRHYKVERDHARAVVRTIDRSDTEPVWDLAREPVAAGAEHYGSLPVATSSEDPWVPQSSVRIRRWDP